MGFHVMPVKAVKQLPIQLKKAIYGCFACQNGEEDL